MRFAKPALTVEQQVELLEKRGMAIPDRTRAADAAYGKKSFAADAERVAFLFDLYRQTTSLLPAAPAAKRRGRSPRRGG